MCVGVPATLHAIYAMKTMGTKRLQMWGFLFVAGTCALIAALWTTLVQCSSDVRASLCMHVHALLTTAPSCLI